MAKYNSHIIPNRSKVLPKYFRGENRSSTTNDAGIVLSYIIAGIIFIAALFHLQHLFLALLITLPGLILLPRIHRWIEHIGRFELNAWIKSGLITLLIIITIPFYFHYTEVDKQEAIFEKQKHDDEKRIDLLKAEENRRRMDSLQVYLNKADKLIGKKNKNALIAINQAEKFAISQDEIDLIYQRKASIDADNAVNLIKSGKYGLAIEGLNNLLKKRPANKELLYQRAICYSKTGKTQEAVKDLKKAIAFGSKEAETLHNKINPIKKRVAYYVTRCRDGSTSGAKGRGACSHHGGVANWNEPVYEEYRQYE